MRVLVTGAAGQLGGEVARQLRAAGHETVGVDLRAGEMTDVVADVRDAEALRWVREVDAVVHAASLHAPHVSSHPRQAFVDANVSGALAMLEAAAAAGLRRFVYTGTTSVYGDAMVPRDGRAVWVDEALEPRARDVYDATKLAAEALCRDVARRDGLSVVILRVCRFFPEPPAVTAVHRLHRGADVRDVAAAHLLALGAHSLPYDVYNVSAVSPFTRDETAELLADAPSVIERHHPGTRAFFAARGWVLPASLDRVYDVSRAVRDLRYAPRHGFAEYLREIG